MMPNLEIYAKHLHTCCVSPQGVCQLGGHGSTVDVITRQCNGRDVAPLAASLRSLLVEGGVVASAGLQLLGIHQLPHRLHPHPRWLRR
jgi:hypothetical protein